MSVMLGATPTNPQLSLKVQDALAHRGLLLPAARRLRIADGMIADKRRRERGGEQKQARMDGTKGELAGGAAHRSHCLICERQGLGAALSGAIPR